MNWYNEPSKWTAHDDSLTMQSEPKTDFWRLTSFRDNGHFYYQEQ